MKAADPQQEDKLRRLLRLKRYEQPPEGFAEEFLEKFQRRQRSEIVRRSSLGIFRERLAEWLHGLRRPGVIWSAAGVYAAVMLTLWLLPRPVPAGANTILVGGTVVTTPNVDFQPDAQGTLPVSTPPASSGSPGKRRTINQEQDKEEIIGPDQPAKREEEKLRDL
jgi:hypothetical protein